MKPIKSIRSIYNQNDIYMLERIGPYSIINDNHQGLIVLVQIYLRNRIKSISHNDWEEIMRVEEYAFTFDELHEDVVL